MSQDPRRGRSPLVVVLFGAAILSATAAVAVSAILVAGGGAKASNLPLHYHERAKCSPGSNAVTVVQLVHNTGPAGRTTLTATVELPAGGSASAPVAVSFGANEASLVQAQVPVAPGSVAPGATGLKCHFSGVRPYVATPESLPGNPPAVSVGSASVVEGTGGLRSMALVVRLSARSDRPVKVAWGTADGTATSPSDYRGGTGQSLTLPPGTMTAVIRVPVVGDAVAEPTEWFGVHILAVTNGVLGTDGVGKIIDDD